MRRKLTAVIALILSAACFLTGCQTSVPSPDDIEGYDNGEEYLSIWVHTIEDTDEGRCYKESVHKFNEAYNGKYFADIEFIPRNDSGGGYSDKINASVMSGGLPDVITVDGPNIAAYAVNNIIQPLAPLTEPERSEYLESILDQGTYNGKLYALGAMESSVGLYYNKDILKSAGVTVPEADDPWTFTEFLEVLEKVRPVVSEKSGYALDMTFPVGEATIYYYAPFFWSNGGDMIDETGLVADGVFNSEKNKQTVEYFKTLLDKGYMSAVPVDKLFESGRAAFKFDGAWEVNTIYTSYPDIDLGVAPYIVGDDWSGERYTPTGSWAFAPTSKTENIEGATELVKWMSGAESGSLLCQKTKSLPSTYKAFEENDIFQTDENYKALYNQLSKYGHPRPKTPVYPQVSTSFQQTLENCVLSGLDIQSELDKSVERINAKLKRYTYDNE